MTQHALEKILNDLYLLHPELKEHERELRVVISELWEARPEVEMDEKFIQELRTRLLLRAKEWNRRFIWSFNWNFAPIAALAVLLLLVGVSYYRSPAPQFALDSSAARVTPLAPQSFGSLAQGSAVPDARGGGGAAAPLESGAPAADISEKSLTSPMMLGGGQGGSVSPMPPDFAQAYRYVYRGGDFELTKENVEVFRRVKGGVSESGLAGLLSGDLGLINLSKFQDSNLQSFTLIEQRRFGYIINVNVSDSSISINENWPAWSDPNCQAKECFINQPPLSPDKIPSDSEVISLANGFLSDYGVPRENYAEPVILDDWRQYLTEMPGFSMPESASVTYPLLLNGEQIYDEGGNPSGLVVSVNLRHRRVSGLWNLTAPRYESSAYPAVTDREKIIKLAENGGYPGYEPFSPSGRVVEIELGSPVQGLVRLWHSPNGQESHELFAPALVFPITNGTEQVRRSNVIVPLVEEILNSNLDGPVRIMSP